MILSPPAPPNKFWGAKTAKAHEKSGGAGHFLKSPGTGSADNTWISAIERFKLLIVERNLIAGLCPISTGYLYISTGQPFFSTRCFCRFISNFFFYFFEKKKEIRKDTGIKQKNANPRVRGAAYFLIHGLEGRPRVNTWIPADRFRLRDQSVKPRSAHHPRVHGLFSLWGAPAAIEASV